MSHASPTLHMVCGKIGSGKSTLCARLADQPASVLVSEDDWLSALYGDQMQTPRDYLRCAARLRSIMGPHASDLLRAGLSVVLDYPANMVETRAWMRGIFEAAGAEHRLHVLDVPDAVCLARLHARNAQGDHPFAATEAQFAQFAKYHAPPMPEEGFTIIRHGDG